MSEPPSELFQRSEQYFKLTQDKERLLDKILGDDKTARQKALQEYLFLAKHKRESYDIPIIIRAGLSKITASEKVDFETFDKFYSLSRLALYDVSSDIYAAVFKKMRSVKEKLDNTNLDTEETQTLKKQWKQAEKDFHSKIASYIDPSVQRREDLLKEIENNPDSNLVWEKIYTLARQEELAGESPWSEFDEIPAEDLIMLSEKVRGLSDFQDRYRLMAEKAPNGKIWFDILTGFSSPEIEYGIDQHLTSQVDKRGGARFKVGLDIGCGTGRVANTLADHCEKTMGLDISDGLLPVAQARSGKKVNYVRGDATRFPLKEEEVDVITSVGLMGALNKDEQIALLTEVFRVLKDGGMFIVGYNKPDNIQNKLTILSWKNTLADMITDRVSGRSKIGGYYLSGHEMDRLTLQLGLARVKYEYGWVKGADILAYHKDTEMLTQQQRVNNSRSFTDID